MDRIRAACMAFLIEYHWFWIMRYRCQGERLLESGEPLSSPRLITLTKKIDRHGMRAFYWEDAYESAGTVSYTHLDVYKRQGHDDRIDHSPFDHGRRFFADCHCFSHNRPGKSGPHQIQDRGRWSARHCSMGLQKGNPADLQAHPVSSRGVA